MGNSGFLTVFNLSVVIKFVNQILLSVESAAMAVFPVIQGFWLRPEIESRIFFLLLIRVIASLPVSPRFLIV